MILVFGSLNADLVFDTRCLPKPHWKLDLRPLTGKDREVIEFLEAESAVGEMYADIQQFLTRWLPRYEANNRSYITIAVGCTGGQHRSVYLGEKLRAHFAKSFSDVQVRHRDLTRHKAR
jgi:RNase adapter protein RapZ